jgi:hypothetical protein
MCPGYSYTSERGKMEKGQVVHSSGKKEKKWNAIDY